MRHPHYSGRKAESVASVGSRLAGVVKPSYGKPKLRVKHSANDITIMTGTAKNGESFAFGAVKSFGPADIEAKNPRRLSRKLRRAFREIAVLNRFAKRRRKLTPPRIVKAS